jgi:hypothetical protein
LAGRFTSQLPILNWNFGAILLLVAIAVAGWLLVQHYFTREDGMITFQGSSWVLNFPLVGEKAEAEAYLLVNTIFAARQSQIGYYDSPTPGGRQPALQSGSD